MPSPLNFQSGSCLPLGFLLELFSGLIPELRFLFLEVEGALSDVLVCVVMNIK